MSVAITVQVPDALAVHLEQFGDRLPDILERGLRDLVTERLDTIHDEQVIIEVLASQPSPEQMLALQPSLELQTRVSSLLARSKEGDLSRREERELERYLTLEHLVRMAKAHAYQQVIAPV